MKIEIKPNGVTLYGHAVLTGNATFNQDLRIIGNLYINTNGFINNSRIATENDLNNISITNNATFGNVNLNRLNVLESASFNNSLFISGQFSISTLQNNLLFNSNGLLINSNLNLTGSVSFNNNLFIGNSINISSNTIISGNTTMNTLYVSGNSRFNSLMTVSGGLVITGNVNLATNNLYISGPSNLNSDLTVSGNTTINTLYVSGNSIFNSQMTVSGGLVITGNVNLATNNLYISGPSNLNSDLTVSGNTTMNTLYVSGNSRFNSQMTVSGGLVITGNVNLATNNLYVSGPSNLNSDLTVSGNTTMNTLYVSGNAMLNSGLNVSGNTTITGSVSVRNNVSISGGLTVSNNTNVNDIYANSIYIKNQLTNPLFLNYISLDNINTTYNLTFGNNLFVVQPTTNTIVSTAYPSMGIVNGLDFSGNQLFVVGNGNGTAGSNYSLPLSSIQTSNQPIGSINSVLYYTGINHVILGGTFPDFTTFNTNQLTFLSFSSSINSWVWSGYQGSDNLGGVVNVMKRCADNVWVGLNGFIIGSDTRSLAVLRPQNSYNLTNADSRITSTASFAINDILVSGNTVYVGGSLLSTNQTLFKLTTSGNETAAISNINFTDVSSQSFTGSINALGRDTDNNIYVGGTFTYRTCKNILKYTPSTDTWNTLGLGINEAVNTISIDSKNNIYAGTSLRLYKFDNVTNSFKQFYLSSVNCKTSKINIENNIEYLYFTDAANVIKLALNTKPISFQIDTYDGFPKVKNILFQYAGENVQIASTSNFSTIVSKSPQLLINYV